LKIISKFTKIKVKPMKKFLVIHGLALISILFFLFIYKCPIHYFLHIPCPTCGITRACIAAMFFHWGVAFRYHPMFFTVPLILIYVPHRNILKIHLNNKIETIGLIVIVVLYLSVYIFRLFNHGFFYEL